MLSPEIDGCVVNLLMDLHRFQTRAYLKDPIKVIITVCMCDNVIALAEFNRPEQSVAMYWVCARSPSTSG